MGHGCSLPTNNELDVEKGDIHKELKDLNLSQNAGIQSSSTTAANTVSSFPNEKDGRSKPTEAVVSADTYNTITIPLEDYPSGYPLLAAFQSSESSFSIYRSFDYLHSRVILHMQDEIRVLEKDLERLDYNDLTSPSEDAHDCLTSRDSDIMRAKEEGKPSKRESLLSIIRDKLVRYDEVLVKARELNAFQRPSTRDYKSLRHWFDIESPLSYAQEEEYVMKKEDLITLRQGREWAGFDGWVESSIKILPKRLRMWLFTTPESRAKTKNKRIHYLSPSRVERLVSLIITLIIFALLVLPVVAMYKLTYVGDRNTTIDAVGLLVVFTLLFSAAMSVLTKAKRHELFAASAAYCAVLVVFISNFNNGGGGFDGNGNRI